MLKYWNRGIYKNTNATLFFDSNIGLATSYHHWNLLITDKKKKFILNDFQFSKTTSKHIILLKELLSNLGYSYKTVTSEKNIKHYNYEK